MIKSIYNCTLLIGLFSSLSSAGIPFIIDDAGTIEKTGFEIESSAGFWKDHGDATIGIKHGLTEKMDIGTSFGYTFAPEEDAAVNPLELSMKYAFIPEYLAGSISGTLGETSFTANLIGTYSIKFIHLNVNAGLEADGGIDSALFKYGASVLFNASRLTTGLEIAGDNEELNWWQIGASIEVIGWLAIAAGLGGGFENKDQLSATAGLTFSF